MKISVVMAAWNSEATIAAAVTSFLEQDYPDRELIVVDGFSHDLTCQIVESFDSPLIKLSSERDKGIYDAMNKGLARVSGDAFGFLNSDDRYARKDALSLIAGGLVNADLVSGTLHFVREHDGGPPVRRWAPELYSKGAYARGFTLPHPTTYARRSVLENVGGFRTDFRCAGDYDWLLRALEIKGFRHSIIDEVLVDMRLGGESTGGVRSLINNTKEMLAIRQDRIGSGKIDMALFWNLAKKLKQLRA